MRDARQRISLLPLAAMLLLGACSPEPIVHDLSEREANRLVTRLSAEQIEAAKILQPDGRYAIGVHAGAAQALHEGGV